MIGALLTQNQICCDEKIFLIYCHVNTFDVYLMCDYGGILPNSKRKTSSSNAKSKSVRAEKRVSSHSSQKRGKKKIGIRDFVFSQKAHFAKEEKVRGLTPKRFNSQKKKKVCSKEKQAEHPRAIECTCPWNHFWLWNMCIFNVPTSGG